MFFSWVVGFGSCLSLVPSASMSNGDNYNCWLDMLFFWAILAYGYMSCPVLSSLRVCYAIVHLHSDHLRVSEALSWNIAMLRTVEVSLALLHHPVHPNSRKKRRGMYRSQGVATQLTFLRTSPPYRLLGGQRLSSFVGIFIALFRRVSCVTPLPQSRWSPAPPPPLHAAPSFGD